MPVIVPITSSVRQTFTTQLGEWSFGFYFYYNDRSQCWIMDLYDATVGLPLVLGQPVVLGQDFLEAFHVGMLFAMDRTVHHGEAGPNDLGTRVILPYLTPAEIGDFEVFPPSGTPTDPDTGPITEPPVITTRPVFAGMGVSGGTSVVTVVGGAVTLDNGVVLTQRQTTAEVAGSSWPFSPNNHYIYLLLYGGTHTFDDALTGWPFVMNDPIPVNIYGTAMYLYQSTNAHFAAVRPRVRPD